MLSTVKLLSGHDGAGQCCAHTSYMGKQSGCANTKQHRHGVAAQLPLSPLSIHPPIPAAAPMGAAAQWQGQSPLLAAFLVCLVLCSPQLGTSLLCFATPEQHKAQLVSWLCLEATFSALITWFKCGYRCGGVIQPGGSRGRESYEDLCGRTRRCLEPVRGAEGEERHNRHPAEEERVSEKRGQFGRPCKEPFFSYPTTSCFYSPKLTTVVQDNYRLH